MILPDVHTVKEFREISTEKESFLLARLNPSRCFMRRSEFEEIDAPRALSDIKESRYNENTAVIGSIQVGSKVLMTTAFEGSHVIDVLYGDRLPRIC